MADLTLQRIPFSKEADSRLRMLKARTGITPNYLCRLGFCLSLDEPGLPEAPDAAAEQGREINRFTLLGQYDSAFVGLLKVWMQGQELEQQKAAQIDKFFIAHMNRGIELMVARTKTLADMSSLCP
tara:strand:- start:14628 stop:15005 length:378 start_codon:yes stop_codon:yes gene_type:complete